MSETVNCIKSGISGGNVMTGARVSRSSRLIKIKCNIERIKLC